MIEPTILNLVQIIALCIMLFFWGVSIDSDERARKIANTIWHFSLIIVWICIFLR